MLMEFGNGNVLVFDNGNLCFGVILFLLCIVEFDWNGYVVWEYFDLMWFVFFLFYMGVV